jgi:hypothetical protein
LRDIIAKMGFELALEEYGGDGTLELTLDGARSQALDAHDGELLSALEFVLIAWGVVPGPMNPHCVSSAAASAASATTSWSSWSGRRRLRSPAPGSPAGCMP